MTRKRKYDPALGGPRIAVTLNDAVTKAPALTVNEFAELSLVYLVRYTQSPSVVSFNSLCENIRTQLMPFVPNVTREQSSYWHLVAQGCGTIEMGQINLYQALRHKYGGVMGRGFDRTQLESHLPADQKHVLDRHIISARSGTPLRRRRWRSRSRSVIRRGLSRALMLKSPTRNH